jgi:hypothetical protein
MTPLRPSLPAFALIALLASVAAAPSSAQQDPAAAPATASPAPAAPAVASGAPAAPVVPGAAGAAGAAAAPGAPAAPAAPAASGAPAAPAAPASGSVPLPPPGSPGEPSPASTLQAPVDAPAPPTDPRVVIRVSMPDGRTVVVAEGDHEPRSIGSYAVRVYAEGPPASATDRFVAGLVRPRDGSVERVEIEDLDRDGRADLVVVMRAAGTGGYLSADAFSYASNRLVRRASIAAVPPDADIVRLIAPRVRRGTAP